MNPKGYRFSEGMKICIDARIPTGQFGGVEHVILGLAGGYASLELGDSEITFLTSQEMAKQLAPLVRDNPGLACKTTELQPTKTISELADRLLGQRFSERLKYLALAVLGNRIFRIPHQQDVVTEAFDLIHFPTQQAFWTQAPNIYHPHDLQHLHLPEYFNRFTFRSREYKYRAFCEQATTVAVTSTWIKNDLVSSYGLHPDKIAVIPLAPPNQHYVKPREEELTRIRRELDLPDGFVFYPAQTWPHKNHLGLVRAAARIKRQHGRTVPLVFSGKVTEFRRQIQAEIDRLGLTESVHFLGFVTPKELQALYRLCTAVLIPSRYEAASFPLWEAYLAGAATACAATTSLPQQAQDASLIFDPANVEEIAQAMLQLWQDESLRRNLVDRGRKRVSQFTWERTCSHFLALYRRLINCSEEGDSDILNGEPML